jgi:hypothetical protein
MIHVMNRRGNFLGPRLAIVVASLVLLSGCGVADASLDPWPADGAVMRPGAMFVEPARARPGEIVAVTYVKPWERGILYAIDADLGGWERRHLLISDANGAPPSWFAPGDENAVVEAVGVGGMGPDRVRIPEITEPGDYRICTANAGDNICTPIEITGAEFEQSSQPSAASPAARDIGGESCDEVAAHYGRLLHTRLMAVLPNAEGAGAAATTLTLAADEHLRAAGLAGQCSYAEFAVAAIETLTPDIAEINRVGIEGAPDFLAWFDRVVRPRLSVIELPDRSVRDRRVAPMTGPPAFGDGPWGPLAVLEAPSDSGDFAGLSGNLRIGKTCVTVGHLEHSTPVIWRNSQTHWNVATDTIVFFDPITAQSVELHDGDFVAFGGGGIGAEGGPVPADLPWLNPPDPSCLGEAFGVHSLSQVNDFELRP